MTGLQRLSSLTLSVPDVTRLNSGNEGFAGTFAGTFSGEERSIINHQVARLHRARHHIELAFRQKLRRTPPNH